MSLEQVAQEEFNEQYIGSVEICRKLEFSRVALFHGRARGKLPEPIVIPGTNIFIWKRKEVTPLLEGWKASLDIRRGVKNG